jgi:hypothetical protein
MELAKAGPPGTPTWKPIALTRQLVFDGGYQRKAYKLDTKEIATDDGVEVFVKIDKRQEWLLKAAAGKGARPGALGRTKIFNALKTKLVAAVAASGQASDSQGSAPDGDPMAALAAIAPAPKKRKAYESKRGKDNITAITMPAFDPSAHPGDERQRVVHLLASSTTTMWLSERDVEWLVTCVADEYQTGGVPLDQPAVAGDEEEGNCAAPGVRIQWDFEGAWEATMLRGEQQGQTCKSMVEKLNLDKWTAADAVHHYGTDFGSATPKQLKQATFDFLELHMQRLVA